ncbi:hypothetical protein NLG97_g5849 [Lecanicillium saksenae]|uniref:Uncharacterized protein n=1 Tax=Lecanicillium saksenae TaxID=468837 RepID=A0ACC1QUH3_9HYPO|nr:hypothetical protein NLG97_g5849 [Lecanicillium saksenae]
MLPRKDTQKAMQPPVFYSSEPSPPPKLHSFCRKFSTANLASYRTCCAMATSSSQSGATMRGSMWPFSAISLNRGHICFSSLLTPLSRYTGSGGAPPSCSAVVGLMVVPLRAR